MTELKDIDARAERLAQARETLAGLCAALQAGLDDVNRQHLPGIRKAVQVAARHHDELKALIEATPVLFQKPKTLTLHGIRFGYMKGKGGIEWDDGDAVVAAIQKHLPGQAEQLIRWTAKPLKEAINQLDVATLKRIGCRVVDTGDVVFIKPVDSAVDKLVDALLKAATDEEGL